MNTNDTPRTEEHIRRNSGNVRADFARMLERELAEAKAKLEQSMEIYYEAGRHQLKLERENAGLKKS